MLRGLPVLLSDHILQNSHHGRLQAFSTIAETSLYFSFQNAIIIILGPSFASLLFSFFLSPVHDNPCLWPKIGYLKQSVTYSTYMALNVSLLLQKQILSSHFSTIFKEWWPATCEDVFLMFCRFLRTFQRKRSKVILSNSSSTKISE